MTKFSEVKDMNLNGFTPFFKQEVLDSKGRKTLLYFLSKGNYKDGFKEIRGTIESLELLTRLEMTDTNDYQLADGTGLADN